ncbi:kielin/chordin-like protein [Mytilus californianus]|uniref:kielin/chordin-like protein n=1 Tax=Mytilus californianus TaxID=6549 RepID=UPI0022481106|nr:kielin/chordin-like protein [Mytilus californianus]
MNILLICFVFGVGITGVLGRRCVVYTAGETIPAIPKGARLGRTCHSLMTDQNMYCIEWDCPAADCSDPIIPETGCPYCKGTCVVNGSVYQEGVSFKCPDGCNTCTCSTSTLMGCGTPPPECSN